KFFEGGINIEVRPQLLGDFTALGGGVHHRHDFKFFGFRVRRPVAVRRHIPEPDQSAFEFRHEPLTAGAMAANAWSIIATPSSASTSVKVSGGWRRTRGE